MLHVNLLSSDIIINALVLPSDFVVVPISFAVSLLSLAVAMHGAPATSDLQTWPMDMICMTVYQEG